MSKLYEFEKELAPAPLRRLSEKEAAGDYSLHWPLVLDSVDESVAALLEFRYQARMVLHNQALKIRALESEAEQLKAEKAESMIELAKCKDEQEQL